MVGIGVGRKDCIVGNCRTIDVQTWLVPQPQANRRNKMYCSTHKYTQNTDGTENSAASTAKSLFTHEHDNATKTHTIESGRTRSRQSSTIDCVATVN